MTVFSEKMLEDLKQKKEDIHAKNRGEKQHVVGKMTAWERIQLLMDKDTFVETDMFLEHRCSYFDMAERHYAGDGVITGYGKVGGKTVCVYAQDFTVYGGSISEMNSQKISNLQKKALSMGVPIVALLDSGGARVQEGLQSLSGLGHIFYNNVASSGRIPQIAAIMGTCAGGAAYSPALSDFVIMVDNTSKMFITGPKVVKSAIGQEVTMDELGGSSVHSTISGVADKVTKDEKECIEFIKILLDYLPSNYQHRPRTIEGIFSKQKGDKICKLVPNGGRQAFDMRELIDCIIDDNSAIEIKEHFAENIITTLARINGYPVGIVANQSLYKAGAIDIDAADKAAGFIRMCDSFNIPLLNLVDVSGFFPGKEQEQKGIIRHGAKMVFAYCEATTLKITVIIRKSYGGAYLAMCSKELGADMVFAWPGSEMAVMSAEAAIDVLYKKASPAMKEIYKEEYQNNFLNPFEAARRGYVDEVIEPNETRGRVLTIIENYWNTYSLIPKDYHHNIPL